VVVDTRDMADLEIAEDRKTATIGAGFVMRDLVERLDAEGLITPVGNVGVVGYVGWATLGGYGPLHNSLGLGIEQIVGDEIVTAEGQVVKLDDERLEGIRGLGGNLGVITALTIKVYPRFDVSSPRA
jgi:FAD/FMN-containing dehydrogenase